MIFSLTLLASISWADPATEDFVAEDLMPLAVGNRWTYRVNTEDRLVIVVARREKVGEESCVRLESRGRDEVPSSEHLIWKPQGLYRFRNDGLDIEPPLLVCKFPIKKGDKWDATYKVFGKAATVRYETDEDTISVPAGKFKTVIIRADFSDDKSKIKSAMWYAPKVGIVKQVIEEGKSVWTLELEKFEPGVAKK